MLPRCCFGGWVGEAAILGNTDKVFLYCVGEVEDDGVLGFLVPEGFEPGQVWLVVLRVGWLPAAEDVDALEIKIGEEALWCFVGAALEYDLVALVVGNDADFFVVHAAALHGNAHVQEAGRDEVREGLESLLKEVV